jgi:glycosyltransferase involved in cell wall biosynthesis
MRAIRVLHVVGSMNRGGIETWLMSVIRHVDRSRFLIDFLVSNQSQSPLEKEIHELGSKIHVCMAHSQPLRYAYNLTRILRAHGPYDIVHSHLHHLNGIVSMVAALSGVRVRIAHSHFNISGAQVAAGDFNSPRYRFARALVNSFATGALGCSAPAGQALFGPDWERRPNRRVLLCGIDLEPFQAKPDRSTVRSALGIPNGAVVIGHAGRFVPEKNHSFFIEIANSYGRLEPRAHFLLVGDGPLWAEMKQRVAGSPIASRFHFMGSRDDVPHLMLAGMDCFLFPSRCEGAPIALIEAQAAGLPCVLSDVIPPEMDLIPTHLWRLSLERPAEEWAAAIGSALQKSTPETRSAAFREVESSPLNITRASEELENYYLQLCGIRGESAQLRQRAVA